MRVLFITNRFPGRATRGDQVRAFAHIRHLSARHAITLLSFAAADTRAHADELAPYCERIVVAPRQRLGMLARALAACFSGRALQVAAFDGLPASAGLAQLIEEQRIELAHVQLLRLAAMQDHLRPVPCVFDLVDSLSLNMARRAQSDRGPTAWIAGLEAPRLARLERATCASAAAVVVCSSADRAAIGCENLQLVGNGVDLSQFNFHPQRAPTADLVFVGNLGYFPNVEAVSWFCHAVMPRLAHLHPQVRLRLVGARPAVSLQRIAGWSSVIDMVGPVPDVRPYLAQAAIAVVPMRAGTGQQLKLLEAMAMGTPTVVTSLAAAAVNARDGVHVLIADSADAMVAAITKLLSDAALRLRIAAAARALVEREYSWEASAAALERVWLSACPSQSSWGVPKGP